MPEHALLSLRSRKNADEWNENVFGPLGFTPLGPAEAIERLAELPLSRFGVLQRLEVIHDLARDDLLPVHEEETRKLVSSAVGPERSEEAWNLAREVASGVSLAEFISRLQGNRLISLRLKPITRPECNAKKLGNGAIEITASYETPGEVPEFYFGADPMNWPVCNPFFLEITRRGGWFRVPDADNLNGRGYGSRIEEVVGVRPFFEWRTFLNVRYFVAETAVGMEFDLTHGGDGAIDVDHGFVVVEARPDRMVRVRSEKTVHFARLPNAPAEFACHLGWVDMMQGMAICERGSDPCAVAEDLTDLAEVSVREHTDRVVKACQKAGEGDYGVRYLMRDTARFWSQVMSDSARAGVLVGKYLLNYSKDGDRSRGATGDQTKHG